MNYLIERPSHTREIERLLPVWENTGMLKDIDDPYQKGEMVVALENQRLVNEVMSNKPAFMRCSIPLVRRIYDSFVAFHMVSVQTLLGPAGLVYHWKRSGDTARPISSEVAAKTRKLRPSWTHNEEYDLDKDTEYVSNLSKAIRDEMSREIFTDLRNNAGFQGNQSELGDLMGPLATAGTILFRKVQADGQLWIVTNKKFADQLVASTHLDEKNKPLEDGVYFWGVLNSKYKLIVDTEYPDEMLVGYYRHFDAGYIYAPYIPLTLTPVVLSMDDAKPYVGILHRYGKKLVDADYYARLTFGPKEEEKEADAS